MRRVVFLAVLLAGCTPAERPDEPVADPVEPEPAPDFAEATQPAIDPDPLTLPWRGDTDAGIDTDEPEDTDPPRDLKGTVTWKTWTDGAVTCDATFRLGGDRVAPCAGCDDTWTVALTPTHREGSCNVHVPELFGAGELAWAGRWTDPWRDLRFRDVLLSAEGDDAWSVVQRDRDKRGEANKTDESLTWAFDRTWGSLVTEPDAYDECDGRSRKRATPLPLGPWKATGDVPCDGTAVDAWTVTLPVEASLGIDTLDKDAPFDPYLWVNDPEGCTVYEADDAAACTRPPPEFGCPGLTLPAGTWTVYVGSRGQCSAGPVAYVIRVDGDADPGLVVHADDEATGQVVVHRIAATGSLTIED